jgi:hypothetical protein
MILLFFLNNKYPGTIVFGWLNRILWKIVIPSEPELVHPFSGSEKFPYPMTVCNLWNHIPGEVNTAPCTEKELLTHGRHVYSTPEV